MPDTSPATAPVRPRRRLVAAATALAVVLVTLAVAGPGILVALFFAFLILGGLERLFRRHRYRTFRPGVGTDIVYFLLTGVTFLGVLAIPFVLVSLGATFLGPVAPVGLALRTVVGSQPGWLQAIEVVLAVELIGYWTHRLLHEVPFLWRFHSVHHSSPRLDWLAGFRTHPAEGAFVALALGPLLIVGFDFFTVGGVFAVVQAVSGALAHANVRWRLRPLHRVILTPEYHHWHHANEPGALYKNYAGGLPLMDMLFGTYFMPRDRRPQVYGTDDPVPDRFARQLAHPFRRRARRTDPTDALAPLG